MDRPPFYILRDNHVYIRQPYGHPNNKDKLVVELQARLDAVAVLPERLRERGRRWQLHEKVLNDAADELEQALEQKDGG